MREALGWNQLGWARVAASGAGKHGYHECDDLVEPPFSNRSILNSEKLDDQPGSTSHNLDVHDLRMRDFKHDLAGKTYSFACA